VILFTFIHRLRSRYVVRCSFCFPVYSLRCVCSEFVCCPGFFVHATFVVFVVAFVALLLHHTPFHYTRFVYRWFVYVTFHARVSLVERLRLPVFVVCHAVVDAIAYVFRLRYPFRFAFTFVSTPVCVCVFSTFALFVYVPTLQFPHAYYRLRFTSVTFIRVPGFVTPFYSFAVCGVSFVTRLRTFVCPSSYVYVFVAAVSFRYVGVARLFAVHFVRLLTRSFY